jgi:hypothetical protein
MEVWLRSKPEEHVKTGAAGTPACSRFAYNAMQMRNDFRKRTQVGQGIDPREFGANGIEPPGIDRRLVHARGIVIPRFTNVALTAGRFQGMEHKGAQGKMQKVEVGFES